MGTDDDTRWMVRGSKYRHAMKGKLKSLVLAALLSLSCGVAGCHHCYCAPKDLFLSIDRYCFVADWMNEHSCTSCYWGANNRGPSEVVSNRVYDADKRSEQHTEPAPASK